MKALIKDLIPPLFLRWLQKNRRSEQRFKKADGSMISETALLAVNAHFKNKHLGQRCIIAGTGTSLATQDLSALKGELFIGLNEFFLHPKFAEFAPTYMVFSGFGIHNIPMEKRSKWYHSYHEHLKGIAQPLINSCDFEFIQQENLMADCPPAFFSYTRSYEQLDQYGIDGTQPLYASQSVGAHAIQLALYMGFSEIVLVGFDHDWILRMFDQKPTHFYEQSKSIIYHDLREVATSSLRYELDSLSRLLNNYEYLLAYAKKQGQEILNATDGGMIDLFPRVTIESLAQNKILPET